MERAEAAPARAQELYVSLLFYLRLYCIRIRLISLVREGPSDPSRAVERVSCHCRVGGSGSNFVIWGSDPAEGKLLQPLSPVPGYAHAAGCAYLKNYGLWKLIGAKHRDF